MLTSKKISNFADGILRINLSKDILTYVPQPMNLSPEKLWDKCLALIHENTTEQQYNAWFKSIVFESFNEESKTVLIRVPSPFVYEYLEENYVDLLRK